MEAALAVAKEEVGGELIQLVSFSLDDEEFGVEVLKVREIIRVPCVTRVPNTPPYVEGVINLRGKVIPIMSIRKRFGIRAAENDKRTRIIVMDVDDELMGFIVDSVSEVIRVSEKEIQPPPTAVTSGIDHECMSGVINQAERLLVLLELEKISSQDEKNFFTNMSKDVLS